MVATVQAAVDTPHGTVLIAAPALVGQNGQSASLLVSPDFGA
jgi:hypothetical protein